jgi:hypothetical protein
VIFSARNGTKEARLPQIYAVSCRNRRKTVVPFAALC